MKKIICLVLMVFVLAGCVGPKDLNVDTFVMNYEENGIKMEGVVDLEHDGKYVVKQSQKFTMIASTDEIFEVLSTEMKKGGFEEITVGMEGVEYKLSEDKASKTITENIIIDITSISGEDYKTMTNGQAESSGDKVKVLLKPTISNLVAEGFTLKQ